MRARNWGTCGGLVDSAEDPGIDLCRRDGEALARANGICPHSVDGSRRVCEEGIPVAALLTLVKALLPSPSTWTSPLASLVSPSSAETAQSEFFLLAVITLPPVLRKSKARWLLPRYEGGS